MAKSELSPDASPELKTLAHINETNRIAARLDLQRFARLYQLMFVQQALSRDVLIALGSSPEMVDGKIQGYLEASQIAYRELEEILLKTAVEHSTEDEKNE